MMFSNYFKNERAFTLIEMMIVLMIISVLLLIALPNMTKNNTIAQEKGCEATIDLVQAQVGAYQIENGELPANLDVLVADNYLDKVECSGDVQLSLNATGQVVIVGQ